MLIEGRPLSVKMEKIVTPMTGSKMVERDSPNDLIRPYRGTCRIQYARRIQVHRAAMVITAFDELGCKIARLNFCAERETGLKTVDKKRPITINKTPCVVKKLRTSI
ncbi:hypothetical protein NSE_0081 [Neorickettsia sennetsu str. Miyayama]|uniref:Uncharacterized protein n=1 Tax=Ehrlichia sennetsu (strain ATCC VR-367 / Miyayama) TaxID=222891 RepID=Q2GEW4_EHRS3|nr:hypothetical protein NSE_0081 [Neorickettsia sennetsu str. Miyayama]